jgi:hypothetical protein
MAGSTVRVVITGDATGLKKATTEAGDALGTLEKTGGGISSKLAGAFSAVAVAKFALDAVKAASAIEESTNKLNVLIGESARGIQDWAKTTASSFGISRREALEATGTFANLFNGLGKGHVETAAMSREFVQLAADMASFNNTSVKDAMLALQSALAGRTMPLRRFGILLDAATLKQRAFNMGLVESTVGVLPPAIRVQAAYAEILDQSTKQQGDFTRTAESTANQIKTFQAKADDAKIAIGEAFTPAVRGAAGALGEMLPLVSSVAAGVGALIGAIPGSADQFVLLGGAALAAKVALGNTERALIGVVKAQNALARTGIDPIRAISLEAASAAAGPLAMLAAVMAGIAAITWINHVKEQQAIKSATESLTAAMTEAQVPIAVVADQLEALRQQQSKNAAETENSADKVASWGTKWVQETLAANDAYTAFVGGAGLSSEDLWAALEQGSEAVGRLGDSVTGTKGGLAGTYWFEKATPEVQKLASALNDSYVSGKLTTDEFNNVRAALKVTADAYKKSREEIGKLIQQRYMMLADGNAEEQQWIALNVVKEEGVSTAEAWNAASDKLIQHLKDQGINVDALGDKTKSSEEAIKSATGALEENADATDNSEKATKEYNDSIEEQIDVVEDQLKALDKQRDALIESFDKEAAYASAVRDSTRGQEELAEKRKALDDVLANGWSTQDEITEATRDYEDSLADNEDKLRRIASAEVDRQDSIARSAGLTLDAATKSAIYRDKMNELKSTIGDPTLQAYLAGIISSMDLQAIKTGLATTRGTEYLKYLQDLIALGPQLKGLAVMGGFVEAGMPLDEKASGGPVSANTPYIVGERGPELFVPQRSGTIVPNKMIGSGSGSVVINVNTPIGRPDDVVKWISQELRRYGRGQR